MRCTPTASAASSSRRAQRNSVNLAQPAAPANLRQLVGAAKLMQAQARGAQLDARAGVVEVLRQLAKPGLCADHQHRIDAVCTAAHAVAPAAPRGCPGTGPARCSAASARSSCAATMTAVSRVRTAGLTAPPGTCSCAAAMHARRIQGFVRRPRALSGRSMSALSGRAFSACACRSSSSRFASSPGATRSSRSAGAPPPTSWTGSRAGRRSG